MLGETPAGALRCREHVLHVDRGLDAASIRLHSTRFTKAGEFSAHDMRAPPALAKSANGIMRRIATRRMAQRYKPTVDSRVYGTATVGRAQPQLQRGL